MPSKNTQNTMTFIVLAIATAVVVVAVLYVRDRKKQRELRLRQYQMQNNLPHEWAERIQRGQMGLPLNEDVIVL